MLGVEAALDAVVYEGEDAGCDYDARGIQLGEMYEWMDMWMDGWMDGWMDVW